VQNKDAFELHKLAEQQSVATGTSTTDFAAAEVQADFPTHDNEN